MRVGAFELREPLPVLVEPHALAVLQPWIDVGNVGTLLLGSLESKWQGTGMGQLFRPGTFFDFTRYRPYLYMKEGRRELGVPNVVVSWGKSASGKDVILLRLLEPHVQSETFVDSVLELFRTLEVRSYCLLGSMYDMTPHTRPLLVTGSGSNLRLQNELETAGVPASEYVGPTSITLLIGQSAVEMGIESRTIIVHLPQYLTLENDYRGVLRLLQVLDQEYGCTPSEEEREKAGEQAESVAQLAERMMEQEPRYRPILKHLEDLYDSRINKTRRESQLSPELEQLLENLSQRLNQG